jgi:hypothetical protein
VGVNAGDKSIKRALLVLDIRGVLMDEVFVTDKSHKEWLASEGHIVAENYAFFVRPELHLFLEMCFSRFDVAIWTCTRSDKKSALIRDSIFTKEEESKFCFFWNGHQCYDTQLREPYGTQKRTIVLKDVRRIWREFPDKYDQTNTVVVDTVPYRLFTNKGLCALFPRTYYRSTRGDDCLMAELWPVLREMSHCRDVRLYMRWHSPRWSLRLAVADRRHSQKIYSLINSSCQHLVMKDDEVSKLDYDVLELSALEIEKEKRSIISDIQEVDKMSSKEVAITAAKLGFHLGDPKWRSNPRAYLRKVVQVRDSESRFRLI